nr:Toll-like receptor protein [Mimachlamys nobilis]
MMFAFAVLRWYLLAFVCVSIPVMVTSIAHVICPPCKCTRTMADCSGLRLSYIPTLPDTIKVLNFSMNRLGNLSSYTFYNIRGIKTLNISDNYINDVAKDTFSGDLSQVLEELDLSDNQFTSPTRVFRALSSTSLLRLSLSNTSLHFSNFSALEPLANVPLRRLDLGGNSLKILKGNLTKSLPKLQTLDLTENFIASITLADLHEELEELNIDENILKDFPSICLKKNSDISSLPRLRILSLSSNLMTTLRGLNNSKPCLQNLETLILDNNHFFELGDNAFSGLPKLQTLSLDLVSARRLSIDRSVFNSTSLRSLTFGSFQQGISLGDSLLKIFNFCPNLTYLKLSGVSFSKWTQDIMRKLFAPLTKLKYLSIVNTDIRNISAPFLPEMQNLVYLNFRDNYISSWMSSVFQNATSLKTLVLSNNHITHLNESFLPQFLWENIRILDLSFNPFDCSCELYWFKKWLDNNSERLKNYPKIYFCKSPSQYKDKRLKDYDPSYRDCHPISTVTIAMIVSGCVLVALISIAVILYRNRWHIKYYIYLLRSKQGYKRIPGNDNFVYDAFVAYNSTDRVWVISKLREFLENQHGMKLCLHERDFNAGRLIVDNIVENIRQSGKVMLILSNEFAKSQWCQFETLLAQNRFFEEGASSLVLVMLEDVNNRYLNGPLSLLLKSMTYIEWSKDPVGKEIFWNKLLDSLR